MSEGIHVSQKSGRWAVTRGNYTLEEFKTQQQAVVFARQRARSSKAALVVHAEDGSVRFVETFQSEDSRKARRTARSAS